MKKILVVEDDTVINGNIVEALKAEQYQVQSAYDGDLAERMLKREEFDLIILDVNLPSKSGFEVCKSFRKMNTQTPVIMLTAFSELEDKVEGFESGANDYITKPFYMRELLLRIHALLKRAGSTTSQQSQQIVFAGDIWVDKKNKVVKRYDQVVKLTPREYQVLIKLIEANGELVTKKELIAEIWGRSFEANTNTIEVYINFLRKKIDKAFDRSSIQTKVGYGYYFDAKK